MFVGPPRLLGNPAAIVEVPAWPDDAAMLAAAQAIGAPDTAFVMRPEDGEADHGLRWFSPKGEVQLCGHATLAAGHVLLTRDPQRQHVRFATRFAGILTVERAGDETAISLPRIDPEPHDLPDVIAALGLQIAVASLWHPAGYAVIVLPDAAAVRAVVPDLTALAAARGDVMAIVTAPGDIADVVSRVFVPRHGGEDAVTGSAHAVVAAYWTQRLGRTGFEAEQASPRGGRLTVSLDGPTVRLAGRCLFKHTEACSRGDD
ncbi:PhzF family phenazine biosynthesis protein [Sphingomonas metalli]|uniref:PhzF family phenazine biosynthesis protein n=1 Tax=Sphingomonas metalli TaxID=1779358 RepID=UPI001E48A530|nr:PhzF family phenazine biosynthesis isomerase [Sphingomonas metalli]